MVASFVTTSDPPEGSAMTMASTPVASDWMADLLATPEPATASSQENPLGLMQRSCRTALAGRTLPSGRDEAWRFTDARPLAAIAPSRLVPSSEDRLAGEASGIARDGSCLRLQVDGQKDPLEGVTLPHGLEPIPDSELQARLGASLTATGCEDHWATLLNGALLQHVLALRVTAAVDPLIEIRSDAGRGQGVLPLRVLLVMEEGAQLDLLQIHTAAGASLTSVVVEGHLSRCAQLRHSLVTQGSDSSALLVHLALSQAPHSQLHQTCAGLGWGFSRYEPRLLQTDGEASTVLRGLQLVQHHQLADTHSHVHLAGPEGRLDQLHKAVADQEGRSVFNGAVRVPRKAQRTNAVQMSRNLLLSNRARIDTKPELEIVADDVRCAHGATVSRLEQDELFYLRSRGIASDQAARLLLRGFCEEILALLPQQAKAVLPLQEWMTSLEPGQ